MSRAQEHHWVAEVHNPLRTVVGNGLRQQLEAPQELPSELASLVAQIASPNASLLFRCPTTGYLVSERSKLSAPVRAVRQGAGTLRRIPADCPPFDPRDPLALLPAGRLT